MIYKLATDAPCNMVSLAKFHLAFSLASGCE
jgi:hypothetical protein